MSFSDDLAKEVEEKVVGAYLDFRGGPVAETFLDTAHALAPVKTGALKGGIEAFSGSPPEAFDKPEEADRFDSDAGTLAPASLKANALRLSRDAGLEETYGFVSRAGYSSYQAEGTATIAARPYWQAAIAAMDTVG